MAFDPSHLRDFSHPAPRPSSLDRQVARKLEPLELALSRLSLAEAALNNTVARLAAGTDQLGLKGCDPRKVLDADFRAVEEARDHLNSERLRITKADDVSHCGRLDASDWGQVWDALNWVLDDIQSPTSAGDYTQSNRITASDVVNTGRAA